MTTLTIRSKISYAIVCGQPSRAKAEKGECPSMAVAGTARSTKSVTTQYGESIGLVGDFLAVNCATGETFPASVLYLPDVAMNLLLPAVEAGDQVEFALRVDVRPTLENERSSTGYVYAVSVERNDATTARHAALLQRLGAPASAFALAAPAPIL